MQQRLFFSNVPGGNLACANYVLDVTELPGGGDGPERVPISLEAREASIGGVIGHLGRV